MMYVPGTPPFDEVKPLVRDVKFYQGLPGKDGEGLTPEQAAQLETLLLAIAEGRAGTRWFIGITNPNSLVIPVVGVNLGDIYLNTANGQIWQFSANPEPEAWIYRGALTAETGALQYLITQLNQLQTDFNTQIGDVVAGSAADFAALSLTIANMTATQGQINTGVQGQLGAGGVILVGINQNAQQLADLVAFLNSNVPVGTLAAISELSQRLDDVESDTQGLVTALDALSVTVGTHGNELLLQATRLVSLETAVVDVGSSAAFQALLARMIVAENGLLSTAASITSVSATLLDAQGDIELQAQALQTLQAQVSTLDGELTSISQAVTSLTSTVTSQGTNLLGVSTGLTALETRVTSTESGISSQSSAITSLQASVSTLPRVFLQPEPPIGGTYIIGDMWLDSNDGNKTYVWNGTLWTESTTVSGATVFVQDNPPTAFAIGDLWFDSNDGYRQYSWSGLTWVDVTDLRTIANGTAISSLTTRVTSVEGTVISQSSSLVTLTNRVTSAEGVNTSQATALNGLDTRVTAAEGVNSSQATALTSLNASVAQKNTVFVQAAPPATVGRVMGDVWFDSDDGNKMYLWEGSWVYRAMPQQTKIWFQAAQPPNTNNLVGDLWIDTDDGNKMYVWSGTAWAAADDARIAATATALSSLTTRVNSTEAVNTAQASSLISLDTRVTNAEGTNSSQATAITGLTTRVTATENTNTSQASSLTSLDSRVGSTETTNASQATALTGLDTRVTAAEGVNTSQAGNLTSLDVRLTGAEGTVGAQGTALTALTTRVTNAEGVNVSQGNSLTSLDSRVASTESTNTAQASALSGLDTRVTGTETTNTAQAGSITALQTTVNHGTTGVAATSSALGALTTRVTAAEGVNTSQASSLTSLGSRVTNTETTNTSQGTAISSLDTRVTAAEGVNTSQSGQITTLQSTVNNGSTGVAATANALTNLTTRVTATEGVNTAQGDSITAVSASVTNLSATIPGGGNLLKNATFLAGVAGWSYYGDAASATYSINLAGDYWRIPQTNNIGSYVGGQTISGQYRDIQISYADTCAVVAGQYYIASAWCGAHRCTVNVIIAFLDAAGNWLTAEGSPSFEGYTPNFAGASRLFVKALAPVGAVKVMIALRQTMKGESDAYAWFTQPMVEQARAAQTAPSPWSAGGADSSTAVNALTTRITNAEGVNSAQADSLTTLNTTVAGNSASITSFGTSLNGLSARVGVTVDVNGYMTGWSLNNSGGSGAFAIRADTFSIVSPGGGARTEYSGGNWRVYDAAGTLRVRMGVW